MSYEHVTICFSLPRSRSQWLAWLFGHAVTSWHDPLKHCEHPLNLKWMIDKEPTKPLFIADTSAMFFHEAIRNMLPGARLVYVLRPFEAVYTSIEKQGLPPPGNMLYAMHERLVRKANQAGRDDYCTYDEIDLFARCTWASIAGNHYHPWSWWAAARDTRIDTPMLRQKSSPGKTQLLMQHIERGDMPSLHDRV